MKGGVLRSHVSEPLHTVGLRASSTPSPSLSPFPLPSQSPFPFPSQSPFPLLSLPSLSLLVSLPSPFSRFLILFEVDHLLTFLIQKRNCSTVSVEVRKTQHKYIVGPRGQGLQEILQTSGGLTSSVV